MPNPGQADHEGDGLGDPCDPDDDNDTVSDSSDNCPLAANPSQADFDGDGRGDVCDADDDADGVGDSADPCPWTPVEELVDRGTGCSLDQLCPCDGPRGTSVAWKNHGQYVSCIARTASTFESEGLISEAEKDALVSSAARSACGTK